jgi:hypothetical protein
MAKYVYEGPGPHDDRQGGLVRPGDVAEFDAEPDWGPWRLLDEPPDGAEKPPAAPATPPPAPASASPAPASTPPPAPKGE